MTIQHDFSTGHRHPATCGARHRVAGSMSVFATESLYADTPPRDIFLTGGDPLIPPFPTVMPFFLEGLIPLAARSHVTSMSRATSSDVLSDGLTELHPSSASSQAGGYVDAKGSVKRTPQARQDVIARSTRRGNRLRPRRESTSLRQLRCDELCGRLKVSLRITVIARSGATRQSRAVSQITSSVVGTIRLVIAASPQARHSVEGPAF